MTLIGAALGSRSWLKTYARLSIFLSGNFHARRLRARPSSDHHRPRHRTVASRRPCPADAISFYWRDLRRSADPPIRATFDRGTVFSNCARYSRSAITYTRAFPTSPGAASSNFQRGSLSPRQAASYSPATISWMMFAAECVSVRRSMDGSRDARLF